MNARQFFQLVHEMRTSQREYFRTRSKDALMQSKRLEADVDAEIRRVCALQNRQPGLFE